MASSAHEQQQKQQQADKAKCEAQKKFGTNSPPLEATGSARPMGMASVEGDIEVGYVLDSEQRKAYFGDDEGSETGIMGGPAVEEERGRSKRQTRKFGQSLAAQMDERT